MLRNKTQRSWAPRGKSTCSIRYRLWAAELCTQSLSPPHTAHFDISAMCSLWGFPPSLGALHWREQFLKAKRDALVGVRLSSAWHWASPALGFADFLSLCRLQNYRDLLLDMESILPFVAGLAPVLRSAGALSRWCLKTCKGGKFMASLGYPVHCPQGKPGLSSCLAWSSQAGVHGYCPCHVSCSYQEMFGSIILSVLQIVLGSY